MQIHCKKSILLYSQFGLTNFLVHNYSGLGWVPQNGSFETTEAGSFYRLDIPFWSWLAKDDDFWLVAIEH